MVVAAGGFGRENEPMDLSKLPRLSQSQTPPPQDAGDQMQPGQPPAGPLPVAAEMPASPPAVASGGAGDLASIWLSLIIGLLMMMLGWGFAQWAIPTLLGRPYDSGVLWTTGVNTGKTVAYWDLIGHEALSESAIFIFGLACVLEAAAIGVGRIRPGATMVATGLALTMTLVATIYNLVTCGVLLQDGVTPLLSLLAVAFGGYMVITHWATLRGRM